MKWSTTKLKYVARLVSGGTPDVSTPDFWSETAAEGTPWVTIGDMTRAPHITDTERWLTPTGLADRRLAVGPPGTVLFAMYASVGAVAVLDCHAAWNQAILGVVPQRDRAEARFLKYWLEALKPSHSALFRSNTQNNLNADQVGSFPYPQASVGEQRAIAEYLDTETVRIDALIAKKMRLDRVLAEREGGLLEYALTDLGVDLYDAVNTEGFTPPKGWRVTTLGRVLRQLTNGYVGPTRDILVDEGVQYIQGMHIKSGRVDFARRTFFVTQAWHLARPRISLQPGDVLIVQTGDIGQVAVVSDELGPASCHALLIARPNKHLVSSDYLGLYLQSPTGRHELLRLATGALHPHLEFGVRAAPVLLPPLEIQRELVDRAGAARAHVDTTRRKLDRQVKLLREHRQALVTAAVTGELEIAGVA